MTRWTGGLGRGWPIALLALIAVLTMVGHSYVPNSPGNLGSLLETFLPWVGLSIPLLAALTLWKRSAVAAVATATAGAVWLAMFGHLLLPGKGGGDAHQLRVLTHNIGASNPDPASTVRTLLTEQPDIIALQELTPQALAQARAVLDPNYRYRTSASTIAIWSRHPLGAATPVDVGMGWTRALRTEAQTPTGTVALYIAHLASVRIGTEGFSSDQRDRTIRELGRTIGGEKQERIIVMGDLNGTAYDRSLAPLTFGLTSAQAQAGWGFGFTWPAGFPMARIDHILIRGIDATDSRVLGATGSDHRPILADLSLR